MSEEEIKEALEIIKQPITVNCKEYKYFDQKNYNNLIRVYDNCLWYVNTFNPYLEQLQQENKELKERIKETLNLINEISNYEYDKFCSYKAYLNSLNDIYLTLKGDK